MLLLSAVSSPQLGKITTYPLVQFSESRSVYNPAKSAEKGKWPAASRHFITNQVIRVEGDAAKALTYWFQATNNTADRRTMVLGLFGHYEDELIKIDGEWYFKKRTIYNEGLEGRHKSGQKNPAW